MRTIQVGTDVYAAIWSKRREGEESENDILARMLGCSRVKIETKPQAVAEPIGATTGFYDSRNSVTFSQGFAIFRRYKGKVYSAVATGGYWVRSDNGKSYRSLNQLNQSIVSGQENVWNGNWFYRDAGKEVSIAELRDS